MACGRLEVRGSTFEASIAELSTVTGEFEHADEHSGAVADAVGHAELASKVRSFSSNWDDHREDLLKVTWNTTKSESRLRALGDVEAARHMQWMSRARLGSEFDDPVQVAQLISQLRTAAILEGVGVGKDFLESG